MQSPAVCVLLYALYVNVHGNAQLLISQYLTEIILQLHFIILRTPVAWRWQQPAASRLTSKVTNSRVHSTTTHVRYKVTCVFDTLMLNSVSANFAFLPLKQLWNATCVWPRELLIS